MIFKNAPSKIHALIQMNIANSLLEKEMNMSVYSLFRFKRCLADYITDNMYIQNSKKGKIYTNIKQCIGNTGLGKLVVKQDKVGLYFYEKDKGLSEGVNVDHSTIDNHAGSVQEELKNDDITIGEKVTPIENEKSRQVHAGEQNIIDNHTYVGDNGNLTRMQ